MSVQPSLFTGGVPAIRVTAVVPHERQHPAERGRLAQRARLLARFDQGPVSNVQMLDELRIGNHAGRISELRQELRPFGLTIRMVSHDRKTGLVWYEKGPLTA